MISLDILPLQRFKYLCLIFCIYSFCSILSASSEEIISLSRSSTISHSSSEAPFIRWNSDLIDDPVGYRARNNLVQEQVRIFLDEQGKLQQSLNLNHETNVVEFNPERMDPELNDSKTWLCVSKLDAFNGAKYINLHLLKDDVVEIEIFAKRMGSLCDPSVTILNHRNVPIYFADDTGVLGGDLSIDFKAPQDGKYQMEIRDVEHRKGEKYSFAAVLRKAKGAMGESRQPAPKKHKPAPIRIVRPQNFVIESQTFIEKLASELDVREYSLEVAENCPITILARTRSIGADTDTKISLMNSSGEKLGQQSVDKLGDTQLSIKNLDAGQYTLEVRSLSGLPFKDISFQLEVGPFWKGFRLGADKHLIELVKGESTKLKINIDRSSGYKGRVQFRLDKLQSKNPDITIEVDESKDESDSVTIQLVCKNKNIKSGIYPISINGFGQDDLRAAGHVSTRPSLEKSGLAHSPKLLSKLDGIFFVNIVESK